MGSKPITSTCRSTVGKNRQDITPTRSNVTCQHLFRAFCVIVNLWRWVLTFCRNVVMCCKLWRHHPYPINSQYLKMCQCGVDSPEQYFLDHILNSHSLQCLLCRDKVRRNHMLLPCLWADHVEALLNELLLFLFRRTLRRLAEDFLWSIEKT